MRNFNYKKSNKGPLPNLIIIGAAKCGTTSLHYYLGLHPEISMSREKELNFFIGKSNWDKGIEWYRSNFRGHSKIHGESSPAYTTYPFLRGVPARMHSILPGVKLIYSVRDPIDRIISQYIHNYTTGLEHRKIEDALNQLDNNRYVYRSKYFTQLEQYMAYFQKSNIQITTLEDLQNNRMQTLKTIFHFLGVDETFYSPKFNQIRHKSSEKGRKSRMGLILKRLSDTKVAKIFSTDTRIRVGRIAYLPFSTKIERPALSDSLRERLAEYLIDDITRLREYTGHEFKDWCV
ncbi:sulfotransferase [Thermodesulfobacteriota bacterium]